jgi:hypothetical protein
MFIPETRLSSVNEQKEIAVPKVTKLYGGVPNTTPLRITHRTGQGKKAPSIRVKCGCCDEAFVIGVFPTAGETPDPQDALEIHGVYASIAQWRELLCPLLGIRA